MPPTNTTANESSSIHVPCSAKAYDHPTVTWYRSNVYGHQGAALGEENQQRALTGDLVLDVRLFFFNFMFVVDHMA